MIAGFDRIREFAENQVAMYKRLGKPNWEIRKDVFTDSVYFARGLFSHKNVTYRKVFDTIEEIIEEVAP